MTNNDRESWNALYAELGGVCKSPFRLELHKIILLLLMLEKMNVISYTQL